MVGPLPPLLRGARALNMRRLLLGRRTPVLPTVRTPALVLPAGDPAIGPPRAATWPSTCRSPAWSSSPAPPTSCSRATPTACWADIEEFVTGSPAGPASRSVLATVLYTDIVDSTVQAARLGDRRWRQLLDRHDTVVRGALGAGRGPRGQDDGRRVPRHLRRSRPRHPLRRGDPSRRQRPRHRGAAGLHAGEVERRGEDIGGIAVHIGARVAPSPSRRRSSCPGP